MLITFLSLCLIAAVSQLNHLGGQSVIIPYPRIVCRVFGISLAVFAYCYLIRLPIDTCYNILGIYLIGMAIWAVFHWGQMFMALNGEDHRNYNRTKWIAKICDTFVGVSPLTKLTYAQCKEWGTVYGTVRGLYAMPMYIALAFYLTSCAIPIGFLCAFQGLIYRTSIYVLHAEYKFGILIGLQAVAIILIYRMGL